MFIRFIFQQKMMQSNIRDFLEKIVKHKQVSISINVKQNNRLLKVILFKIL